MSQESSRLFQWAKTRLSVVLWIAHADVRVSEVCQSHHRRVVSCADSTKPLATLGDSDGEDCRDRDGNSLPASAAPAVAGNMGKPHFVDGLLKPFPGDACRDRCSSSARSSGPGTPARHQAAVHPSRRRWSGYGGGSFGLEGNPGITPSARARFCRHLQFSLTRKRRCEKGRSMTM